MWWYRSWSKPYRDTGYDVRIITPPDHDVITYKPPKNVYGILAAPPCTMFSFARNDSTAKAPRDFEKGLLVVDACFRIIRHCQLTGDTRLKFWAMENPRGFLRQFIGKAAYEFDPCDFGDPWTKKTEIWGYFKLPKKNKVSPLCTNLSKMESIKNRTSHVLPRLPEGYMKKVGDKRTLAHRRAITPLGFAMAFFKANK